MQKPTAFIQRLALSIGLTLPTAAHGVVNISLGVSASDNNLPMQKSSSLSGNGSIAFGLTDFMRLGYTHRQEIQESEGWDENTVEDTTDTATYSPTFNRTHVFANSVDITLILYNGVQFMPYLIGGGVIKNYVYDQHREVDGVKYKIRTKVSTKKPVPNVGAGVGIRLNREFSLKISYVASPGYAQDPNGEIKNVWDRYSTVQIGYDL